MWNDPPGSVGSISGVWVLELNAHPSRLDLDDVHCRMAKDLGLRTAISTDAHSTMGSAPCASASAGPAAAGSSPAAS
jgi:hypothetical protein